MFSNVAFDKAKTLRLVNYCARSDFYLNYACVKRTSGTHNKPHILEIRPAFFECALTAPNYMSRDYKFSKDFIQVFYANFEETKNFVKFYISSSKNLK